MSYLKIVLSLIATTFVISFVYIGFLPFSHDEEYGSLIMQNIEALTEGDDPGSGNLGTCTRVKRSHNCYRIVSGVKQWVGTAIDEVETYKRSSLVELCDHAVVTSCPPGCI